VDAGSMINADAQGYTGSCSNPGNGPGGGINSSGGGSYGGLGGQNTAASLYGSQFQPLDPGSAGAGYRVYTGYCYGGGSGGGAIRLIVSGTLTDNGVISANGGAAASGGGAGGSVYVTANALAGSGSFTANGGTGSFGGGGGRVAVYYTSSTFTGYTASTTTGGMDSSGNPSGGAGTVVFINNSTSGGDLHVYQPFAIYPDATATYNSIAVTNGATLTIGGGANVTLTTGLTVGGNSTVIVQAENNSALVNGHWQGVGATINAANLQVDAGSAISADSQGYTGSCSSPGRGPGGGVNNAASGSYGGVGGYNPATSTYGAQLHPLDLGSAGGGYLSYMGYCYGGASGGGAIRLVVPGTLTNNGVISANGGASGNSTAGSGGSLYVSANTVAGSGTFTANGGDGANSGGGGGRVAVFYRINNGLTASSLSAAGGLSNGGAGTAVLSNTPQYLWLMPTSNIFHDTVTMQWAADAVDLTATTVDVVIAGRDSMTIGTGLLPISRMKWDTTTVADSRYDLQLVYRSASGAIVAQLPRNILVNNSIAWHSGTLQSSQTWTADRVNGVDDDVIIPSGVTLTITPGAIVKVAAGMRIIVQNGGVLNAQGTDAQKVIFTTLEDDSVGGDSNLDGNASMPTPGEWPGIATEGGGQFNTNSDTKILYVLVGESGGVATNQTWPGSQLYHITSDVTIPSGVTLTIQPGAVIKFDPYTSLVVGPGGQLVAQGTVAQPIYFTSIKDDSIAGDTNGDGNATSPAAGDWRWIYVDDQASATLDHVLISYGGGTSSGNWDATGVIRTNGSPTVRISDSIIRQSFYDGILTLGGTLTLTNSVLTGADRAINAQPGSTVHVYSSTIDSNNTGVLVHGGTVDVTNSIVSNQKSGGIVVCCSGVLTSVSYTDVWTSVAGVSNYAGTPDLTGQFGNISADPQFRNAAQGDYRLRDAHRQRCDLGQRRRGSVWRWCRRLCVCYRQCAGRQRKFHR